MTAAEFLTSSDRNAVRHYYEELASLGKAGRLASLVLRCHRNTTRMLKYDNANYLKFLRGRSAYAVGQLNAFLECNGAELRIAHALTLPDSKRAGGCAVLTTVLPDGKCLRFEENTEGTWRSDRANEPIILAICDGLMEPVPHD
jgi:hypothetical protein